jgi:hypothetical protein
VIGAIVLLALAGCGRDRDRHRTESPLPIPIHVLDDTSRTERLEVNPPPARAWFARVSPSSPRSLAPRLPDAPPDTSIPVSPPRLEIDPGLKPPILRTPAQLELPESIRRSVGDRPATVELDLRIDEEGYVSKVRWDGVGDSALAEAARRCAEGMRFFPALKGDRPVAVWCRQRFEVGGPRSHP